MAIGDVTVDLTWDSVVVVALKVVIAVGIFNVWVLRFGRATPWRGGGAPNMKEEFRAYGLPSWSIPIVGAAKLLLAALLLLGIWFSVLTRPAAIGLAILMLGAVAMHFKIKDPPRRALPAFTIVAMCIVVALLS